MYSKKLRKLKNSFNAILKKNSTFKGNDSRESVYDFDRI